jgi:hypothetical protein
VRQVLDFLNDELEVDAMMISPAYAYEKAPDQEHFLGVKQTHELFSEAFADGRRRKWRLNHSPLFLDFLEGKVDFGCTAWGIPSYSLFGWQRPCYLMADGYVKTYKELVETTDWEPTAAAATRAATTAWPTAATSRPPCSRRAARRASRCGRCCRADRGAHPEGTGMRSPAIRCMHRIGPRRMRRRGERTSRSGLTPSAGATTPTRTLACCRHACDGPFGRLVHLPRRLGGDAEAFMQVFSPHHYGVPTCAKSCCAR